jgi:hypothetical protein
VDLLIRDLAVPTLSRGLFVAERYCAVLAQQAIARNVPWSTLLEARLSDLAPSFCEHIDGAIDVARSGLVALLDFADDVPITMDRDLAGIKARLAQTIEYVGQADGTVFIDTDEKVEYVVGTMLPAFYLHLASAHAVLRSIGAPIGKSDYLGDLGGLYSAV